MSINARIGEITERIVRRSHDSRSAYRDRVAAAAAKRPRRNRLPCANLAHGFAACDPGDKARLAGSEVPNLGIVTAYNDMLSAHQPYERYPDLIRAAAAAAGGVAQVAGATPAMCDGVTQGEAGMEISLFSRDVIALATGIALSHDMFDAALYLGICDKIVPGLVMGALAFGHLPAVFVPAGPMPTGISNEEKSKTRQKYTAGEVGRAALLASEAAAYHAAGTCTFYGTANSNQMLMELMGLHLPGATFVAPNTPLRDALTVAATRRALAITAAGDAFTPIGEMLDERAFVNGIVGLNATGGSTNHTMHLVAMARMAGIVLTWDDFADISEAVPLVARVYPNGPADVNQFRDAGGLQFVIRELLGAGLLHGDVTTVAGTGLDGYTRAPRLDDAGVLHYDEAPAESADPAILKPVAAPFQASGGLKLLTGNLGRAVSKVSAVKPERHVVEAPARVFHDQAEVQAAFKAGELTGDFVAVVRFQGPRANGMPELHKLTPTLGILQDRGQKVALVTDGRMSGASGKVPSAIHVTPEAAAGGPIARVRDGDIVRLDTVAGTLEVLVDQTAFASRRPAELAPSAGTFGAGRELFATFRRVVGPADEGAVAL
jgi:phosphogluconate dehydratase